MPAKPDASTPPQPCFLCEALTPATDSYCYGCQEYICEAHTGETWGHGHDVHDHHEAEGAPNPASAEEPEPKPRPSGSNVKDAGRGG